MTGERIAGYRVELLDEGEWRYVCTCADRETAQAIADSREDAYRRHYGKEPATRVLETA